MKVTAISTWLRDSLHELRHVALEYELMESERALRSSIIRVASEGDIATRLRIRHLVEEQMEAQPSAQFKELEDLLLSYIEAYGLSENARRYFVSYR